MKRKLLAILFAVFAFTGVMVFAVGCKEKNVNPNEDPPVGQSSPEEGEYYFDADGQEYLVVLKNDRTFELTIAGETKSGKYLVEDNMITLTPEGGSSVLTGRLGENKLTLVINDVTYSFLKKVNFTVDFNAMGGSDVASASVINGKTVTKPSNPTKTGVVFVGWYTDSAYSNLYYFSQPVTGNITLYARYEKPIDPEFKVTLYDGEKKYSEVTTVGGKIYDLPILEKEGATFAGWWTSCYHDSEKLTARYKEQVFEEDTELFAVWKTDAPLVSVYEDGVEWSADGVNNNYNVKIMMGEETYYKDTLSETSLAFNFLNRTTGAYEISVTLGENTTTVYYINKALTPVSVFRVDESTLFFNGVRNATGYELTIDCGREGHHPAPIDLGTNTYYDFSACDMKEGGIVFTVTAKAEGYTSSVSKPYVFERELGTVGGLSVDTNDVVSWDSVPNATSYHVTLSTGGEEVYSGNVGAELHFPLKDYDPGVYDIAVYPAAHGWNSPAPTSYRYTKVRLAAPSGLTFNAESEQVIWNAVKGAKQYEVKIGDKTFIVNETHIEFSRSSDYYVEEQLLYPVTVCALGDTAAEKSLPSDELVVSFRQLTGKPVYSKGVLSWNPIHGVHKYAVQVGSNEELIVENASTPVEFHESGEVSISVYAIYSDEERSEAITTSVTVYEISFDLQYNALEEQPPLFLAQGDEIHLPSTPRVGYTIEGWYTAPGGASGEGDLFKDEVYTKQSPITLYAAWKAKQYTVHLNVGAYGKALEQDEYQVTYDSEFELPVPEPVNSERGFYGWYAAAGGNGARYTDYRGKSVGVYKDLNETYSVELYAAWANLFEYTDTIVGGIPGYMVTARKPYAGYVTEITVPETYNDKPVLTVSGFSSLYDLTTMNIPNTVQIIEEGAFNYCKSLQAVNILKVDGQHEIRYLSYDGVLYKYNEDGDLGLTLMYYPMAKSGKYTVMNGTKTIIEHAFYGSSSYPCNITELEIPASVTLIESNAIASCASLRRITFLESANYDKDEPLVIQENAIYSCSALEALTITNRIDDSVNIRSILSSANALEYFYVEGHEGRYSDVSGVLCEKNTEYAGLTIVLVPFARTSFEIPSGITAIGENAFANVSATGYYSTRSNFVSITIPSWVRYIGKGAFRNLSKLATVNFSGEPNDLDLTIDEFAFYDADALKEIILPANLAKLAKNAFGGINSLTTVTVNADDNGGKRTLDYATGAFSDTSGNTYVKTVKLGDNTPLIDVVGVFGPKVTKVEVSENHKYYAMDDKGILFDKAMKELVFFPNPSKLEGYVIPDTVTRIADYAFSGKTNLQNITIGKNVSFIGQYAFNGCTKLESITFAPVAEGETRVSLEIAPYAFYGCNSTKLTTITFPEGTTKIGASAFANCANLDTINLPSTVTVLGEEGVKCLTAFGGTTKLKDVNINENNKVFKSIEGVIYKLNDSGKPTELCYAPVSKKGEVEIPSSVNFIWENAFNSNTAITEVKFKDNKLDQVPNPEGSGMVPGTLEIASRAFYNCTGLNKVTLPDGVTKIASETFSGCTNLKEVVIPKTVTVLEQGAFTKCSALSTLTFNEGDTPLRLEDGASGQGVFQGCSALTTLTLPERLTYIGTYAFSGSGITSIKIPSTVTTLGANAFAETKLQSVEFLVNKDGLSDLAVIGDNAFYNVTTLKSVKLAEGLRKIGESATGSGNIGVFRNCPIEEINFPSTLESIGACAFYGDSTNTEKQLKVTELTLNEGLKELGWSAFSHTQVVHVHFPASLTTFQQNVFLECKNLESVEFADNNKLDTINKSVFENDSKLTSVDFGENSSLKDIGNAVFASTSIERISIPASIENIAMRAFENCHSLTEVTFEVDKNNKSHLRSIGAEDSSSNGKSFYMTSIETFTFPESYNDISVGPECFKQCRKLRELYISASVVNLSGALLGCGALEKITVEEGNPNYSSSESMAALLDATGKSILLAYGNIEGTFNVEFGAHMIDSYSFFGQTELEEIYIPYSVKEIGDAAFMNCTSLKEVHIGEGSTLQKIGAAAFAFCPNLETVELEYTSMLDNDGLGQAAFQGCSSLKKVDLSRNVSLTSIPKNAFSNCSDLETLLLPTELETVEDSAFYQTNVKELTLPATVTAIQGSAFYGAGISSLVIPNSVTTIGAGAFADCTNLTSVTFASGNEETPLALAPGADSSTSKTISVFHGSPIGKLALPARMKALAKGAFSHSGLTEITDWGGVTEINVAGVFLGSKLQKIKIPNFTKFSGNYMFESCEELTEVTFAPDFALTSLPSYMFRYCTSLTQIELPKGLTYLGTYTFQGSGLTSIDLSGLSKLKYLGTSATASGATSSVYTFADCKDLKKVILPDSLTGIGGYVFQNCENLPEINLANVTEIGQCAFQNCKLITKAEFNSGLKTLGANAFNGCTSLSTVDFKNNTTLKTLGNYAFSNTTALHSITLPTSINYLGTYTFQGSGLMSIDLSKTALTCIGTSATACAVTGKTYTFADCKSLKEVILPENLGKIGAYAFSGCTSLQSFPFTHITLLGDRAFAYSGLKDVELPAVFTDLGAGVFGGCTSLESFKFADGNTKFTANKGLITGSGTLYQILPFYTKEIQTDEVELDQKTIASYAFDGATGIRKITLTAVTTLATYAFYGCEATELVLPETLIKVDTYAFTNSKFNKVELPASLTSLASVGNYAFADSFVQEVVIHSGNGIASTTNLFNGATALTSVTLPESGFIKIGDNWFKGAKALTSVKLPECVTTIGNGAFQNSGITSFTLTPQITSMPTSATNAAFAGSELQSVVIGKGWKAIPNYAFYGAEKLSSVTFEKEYDWAEDPSADTLAEYEKIYKIGTAAFSVTPSLAHIDLPDIPLSLAASVFASSGLKTIVLPEKVMIYTTNTSGNKSMSSDIFENCTSLEVAIIKGDAVAAISGVFEGCTNLKYVKLPQGLKGFSGSAFLNCTSLNLYVPEYALNVTGFFTNNCFGGFTDKQTLYFEGTRSAVAQTYTPSTVTSPETWWNGGGNSNKKNFFATVKYEVSYADYLEEQHIKELLESVGLGDYWDYVQHAYDTVTAE